MNFSFFQKKKAFKLDPLKNIPPSWSMSLSELVEISSRAKCKSLVEMSDICWGKDYLIEVNF